MTSKPRFKKALIIMLSAALMGAVYYGYQKKTRFGDAQTHHQSKIDAILNDKELSWLKLSDEAFANEIARPLSFETKSLDGSSLVAWMYFARLTKKAQSPREHAMTWLNWKTNQETFTPEDKHLSDNARLHQVVSKSARSIGMRAAKLADGVECPANFPPQVVTRNDIAYRYLNQHAKIYSRKDLARFLNENGSIAMPIGSVEVKGVFVSPDCPELDDATYDMINLANGKTAKRPMTGLHIMAKLAPTPKDPFTSSSPSWFWATFEFIGNDGFENVQSMITEKDSLSDDKLTKFLAILKKLGPKNIENYRLSGTQISFLTYRGGHSVLGSSKLEDFAGGSINLFPDYKNPHKWTVFSSSCHACHATAAYNPKTDQFFVENFDNLNQSFPLIVGNLPKSIYDTLKGSAKNVAYDYKHLDFLWPITFQFLHEK